MPVDRLTVLALYMDAGLAPKLLMTGLLLTALAALAIPAARILRPGAVAWAPAFLKAAVVAAPVAGLFGAAGGLLTSFMDIANANIANLAVAAPGLAVALLSLTLGFGTQLIVVIAAALIAARPQTGAPAPHARTQVSTV